MEVDERGLVTGMDPEFLQDFMHVALYRAFIYPEAHRDLEVRHALERDEVEHLGLAGAQVSEERLPVSAVHGPSQAASAECGAPAPVTLAGHCHCDVAGT